MLTGELESLRARLGSKSLPNRAEMLFRHVPVKLHSQIPSSDPEYFRTSTLKEADDLRISIVHGNGLPRIDRTQTRNTVLFLLEAAFVALRSAAFAYEIPFVWDDLRKWLYEGRNEASEGES